MVCDEPFSSLRNMTNHTSKEACIVSRRVEKAGKQLRKPIRCKFKVFYYSHFLLYFFCFSVSFTFRCHIKGCKAFFCEPLHLSSHLVHFHKLQFEKAAALARAQILDLLGCFYGPMQGMVVFNEYGDPVLGNPYEYLIKHNRML